MKKKASRKISKNVARAGELLQSIAESVASSPANINDQVRIAITAIQELLAEGNVTVPILTVHYGPVQVTFQVNPARSSSTD